MKLNNERLLDRRRKADEDESSFQAQEEARKQADANNREARRQADANKRFVERKKKVEQDRNRKELEYVSHLTLLRSITQHQLII